MKATIVTTLSRPHAVRLPRTSTGSSQRLSTAWNRLGTQTAVLCQGAGRHRGTPFVRYQVEMLRLIAHMSLGSGAGGHRRHVVIVAFLTMSVGGLVGIQAIPQFSDVGVEALSGFRVGLPERRLVGAAGRLYRPGRHHRRRRHRAVGRHADQRRDRRARGDGHPHGHLSGLDAGRGRRGRRHSAVLHRRAGRPSWPPASLRPSSTDSLPASMTTTSTRFWTPPT